MRNITKISTNNLAEIYAFSAKERDVETGLSYFGARYYSSDLSIWLSVDPMSDKYPSMSPYVYCADNPVKLVDPNGEEVEINDTKYVNKHGDLLFETNDGSNSVVIIQDERMDEFKNKLQEMEKSGSLDDLKANKSKLYTLGKTIDEYSKETKGEDNFSVAYRVAYTDAYEKKSHIGFLKQEWHQLLSFRNNDYIDYANGFTCGYVEGRRDRRQNLINRVHPENSIKSNKPLIELNKPNESNQWNNPNRVCYPK